MECVISAAGRVVDIGFLILHPECGSDAQDAVQRIASNGRLYQTLSCSGNKGSSAAKTKSRPADPVDDPAHNRASHLWVRPEPQSSGSTPGCSRSESHGGEPGLHRCFAAERELQCHARVCEH